MKTIYDFLFEKLIVKNNSSLNKNTRTEDLNNLKDAFIKAWDQLNRGFNGEVGKGYNLKRFKESLLKEYDNIRTIYDLWEDELTDWNNILDLVQKNLGYVNFDDMYRLYNDTEFINIMKQTCPEK